MEIDKGRDGFLDNQRTPCSKLSRNAGLLPVEGNFKQRSVSGVFWEIMTTAGFY